MDGAEHSPSQGLAVPGSDSAPFLMASESFTADNLTRVRHRLARCVGAAGGQGQAAEDFVLAVYELMTNAVRHAGGRGTVRLTRTGETLTCEVEDYGGAGADPQVHTPGSDTPGKRGLWLAQQLSDALTLTQRSDGLTATVRVCLPAGPSPEDAPAAAAIDPGDLALPGRPSGGDTDGSPRALA